MERMIRRHGLVVSCQALEHEPLHGSVHMVVMARAAKQAGAAGIRANGVADIRAIKAEIGLPVIGLLKRETPGFEVFITPTVEAAREVREAGADIVAIDATDRPRPDGLSLEAVLRQLKQEGVTVMADVSTFEEGVAAAAWGADCVSTTLCGYTRGTKGTPLPDLGLVERLAGRLTVPVIAEGGIFEPSQAAEALRRGAAFVVVGSAITRPQWIAERYVAAIRAAEGDEA